MSEEQLATFRNGSIGFVFQFHYLLPEFSALQNVAIDGKLKNRRRTSNASMLAIGVAEVCAACESILDRQKIVRTGHSSHAVPRPHFARAA